MRLIHQRSTHLFRQAGSNEQYGTGTAEDGGIKLGLVDDEVLVEDGEGDTTPTSLTDKVVVSAKILFVGKDAQGGGTVLLVRQRNDIGTSVFLNPAFRGRTAFELSDDAGIAL